MMGDAHVHFVNEGISGVAPVGSYLSDVARRFGVAVDEKCDIQDGRHECHVTIRSGADSLSALAAGEAEQFVSESRKEDERLACYARIESSGDIEIMTKEKKEEKEPVTSSEQYRREFEALPLDKKISELVRLEAIALGETFSFILTSPMKIFEKVGDMMADFGRKLENEARSASKPAEGAAGDEPAGEKTTASSKGAKQKRTQ